MQVPYRIPFRIYAKIYGNAGYIHNPNPGKNSLNNGCCIQVVLVLILLPSMILLLSFEWTFNQLGQNGLYLHRKSLFSDSSHI